MSNEAHDPIVPLIQSEHVRGYPAPRRDGDGEWLPISEILTREFDTEVFLAGYSLRDRSRLLRINNAVFDEQHAHVIPDGIDLEVFFLDFDCPSFSGPRPGRDWYEAERARVYALLKTHPGGFGYETRKGHRLAFRRVGVCLRTLADKEAYRVRVAREACHLLRTFGLAADGKALAWNNLYRPPHGLYKDRRPLRLGEDPMFVGEPKDIGVWSYEPTTSIDEDVAFAEEHYTLPGWDHIVSPLRGAASPQPRKSASKRSTSRLASPIETTHTTFGARLADLVKTHVQASGVDIHGQSHAGERHEFSNALSGYLLRAGLSDDELEALVVEIFERAGDGHLADRRSEARSTAQAYRAGRGVTSKLERWAAIHDFLHRELAVSGNEFVRRVRAEMVVAPAPEVVSLTAAADVLNESVDAVLRGGIHIVRATAGTGKSHRFTEQLARRDDVVAFIASPTNKNSKYLLRVLADAGLESAAVRRFGTTAEEGCRFAPAAASLASGGHSIARNLCRDCEWKNGCPARDTVEGETGAPLLLTNHAMLALGRAHLRAPDAPDPEAAKEGPLDDRLRIAVIDEAVALCEHQEIDEHVITDTLRALDLGVFSADVARASRPLLLALDLTLAELSKEQSPLQMAERLLGAPSTRIRALRGVVQPDSVSSALTEAAQDPLREGTPEPTSQWADIWERFRAPPDGIPQLSPLVRQAAFAGDNDPAKLAGTATRVIDMLRSVAESRARIEWANSPSLARKTMIVSRVNRDVQQILRGGWSVALLDATASPSSVEAVAGRSASVHPLDVGDGAPIDRVMVPWAGGTRKKLLHGRRVNWANLVTPVTRALELFDEGSRVLVVVYAPIDTLLAESFMASSEMRTSAECGPETIVATIRKRRINPVFLHYGYLRGQNEFGDVGWADLSGILTVADPHPNLDELEAEAALLRVPVNALHEERVASELAQAHGRIRSPRRTTPAKLVHLGACLPAGWHSGIARLVDLLTGRATEQRLFEVADLELLVSQAGSIRALARKLLVDEKTVRGWLKKGIPNGRAEQLRALLQPL